MYACQDETFERENMDDVLTKKDSNFAYHETCWQNRQELYYVYIS